MCSGSKYDSGFNRYYHAQLSALFSIPKFTSVLNVSHEKVPKLMHFIFGTSNKAFHFILTYHRSKSHISTASEGI